MDRGLLAPAQNMDRIRHATILPFPRSPLGEGQAVRPKYPEKWLPDNRTKPIWGDARETALYRGPGRLFRPRPGCLGRTSHRHGGKPQPDQHWHEHATCFRLGDRGLVVITSCGHGGIINTLKRAQEVSGVEKIYALVGGFHLAPAPDDYLRQVMTELKKFDLEHVMPMHCSGQNFVDLAKQEMPEKLVLCTTGSRFTFTA